jgi:HSP20 family protein
MDRVFDRFAGEPWGLSEPKALRAEGWVPPLDVSEAENEVTIRAEIPGIAAKDLDISVSGTTLSISGQKQEEQEKKGENYYMCERRFGSFRREVELPDTVDPDKITAESDNSVITIHVARKPGAKPRHVEVKPTGRKIPVTS